MTPRYDDKEITEATRRYTLMLWSTTNGIGHTRWERIVLFHWQPEGEVRIYHQRLKENPATPVTMFLSPMPADERWQTLHSQRIDASQLACMLQLWGIEPTRALVERPEDV